MTDYIFHVEVSVFSNTIALKYSRIKLDNCYFKKHFKCENDGRNPMKAKMRTCVAGGS